MKKVKFIEEPGFVYDIIYTFVYNFNKEYCASKLVTKKCTENCTILHKSKPLSFISKELYPFFYLKDDDKCFLYEYYYENYINLFDGDYGFSTLYKMISQKAEFKINFIKYYFPKISKQEQQFCFENIEAICEKIRKSEYSDALKCTMYSFFAETDYVLETLLKQLTIVWTNIKEEYESNVIERKSFQHEFKFELIKKYFDNININIESNRNYIIPCTIDRTCFKLYQQNKRNILMVGIDYVEYIDYMSNKNDIPKLDLFGNVIAEKNRLNILDLILKKEEITIKDLEQELKLTGTNAYYHLNIMLKANIIKTRNADKKIYYSINKITFSQIIDLLKRYK